MSQHLPSIWAFLVLSCVASLGAEEPPKIPPGRVVGSVYGKAVTAPDVGLTAPIDTTVEFDARDTARWELMGRITAAFGGLVLERFVKREIIEATRDEIERFKNNSRKSNERNVREFESRLKELKKELANPKLSGEERATLEKERAKYETLVASLGEARAADVPDESARMFIVNWKIEQALHRVYGGSVIFQQAGPEAVDARRKLFEAAEKAGDIKFEDAGVRHMFYYYSNMKHTGIDEKALERPWFLEDLK